MAGIAQFRLVKHRWVKHEEKGEVMTRKKRNEEGVVARAFQVLRRDSDGLLLRRIARMQIRMQTDDRGDVPGWVLVTVMTAGLVTAIWLVADAQLKAVLERAMASLGTK